MSVPYRLFSDGIDLHVRLTPKSSLDAVEGVEHTADGHSHLKARVRAVPEKGLANAALIKLVAKALGTPASAISLTAGETARLKTLHIAGDPAALTDIVKGLIAR